MITPNGTDNDKHDVIHYNNQRVTSWVIYKNFTISMDTKAIRHN